MAQSNGVITGKTSSSAQQLPAVLSCSSTHWPQPWLENLHLPSHINGISARRWTGPRFYLHQVYSCVLMLQWKWQRGHCQLGAGPSWKNKTFMAGTFCWSSAHAEDGAFLQALASSPLKKFGKWRSVSITTYQWVGCGCVRFFMQQMVCYFRIHILISGPFSYVALSDIFTYSSEQSELAASDTCLTLWACVTVVLYCIRAGDEQDRRGVPGATCFQSYEVMSKKVCCQERAVWVALPAPSEIFQLRHQQCVLYPEC